MNLNYIRKVAGLPLVEASDASPAHEQKEHALFKKCCEDLAKVQSMCEARLKEKLTDEHKKQYTDLCNCAKGCCEDMRKHLTSYK
jgi:hypothetical protein